MNIIQIIQCAWLFYIDKNLFDKVQKNDKTN